MRRFKPRRRQIRLGRWLFLLLAVGGAYYLANWWGLLPKHYYSAEQFGLTTLRSIVDFNANGVDDYTDILLGARRDAENKPRYDGAYQPDAYPPDNIGVCTDVVWRAFRQAGYSLKDMVDADIVAHPDLYPLDPPRDPNIDFRRVPNLRVFLQRYALSLTTDPQQIAEWQPGDIVIFGTSHVAIVSDRRNAAGIPYIIHNAGQPQREEDALTRWGTPISGHYRFDASRLRTSLLVAYTGQ